MWQDTWVGAAALHLKVEWLYTIAVLAWCSIHQLSGCNCIVKLHCKAIVHTLGTYKQHMWVYMAIYNYTYMHLSVYTY